MDGLQLPQGYRATSRRKFTFYLLSSQKFLALILPTLEGWKAESTLELASGFEHGTPGLGIQHLNHYATESYVLLKGLFLLFKKYISGQI